MPGLRHSPRGPLIVLLLVLGLVLGGCSLRADDDVDLPVPPTADDLARQSAARDAVQLLQMATSLAAAAPASRTLATRIAAVHRAHLAALGARIPTSAPTGSPGTGSPGTGSPGTGSPSTGPRSPSAPSTAGTTAGGTTGGAASGGATVSPAILRQAEWTAAGAALASVPGTTPALAVLLARIAAARAVDADLIAAASGLRALPAVLAPTPSSTTPSSTTPSSTTPSSTTPPGATPPGATPPGATPADTGAVGSGLPTGAAPTSASHADGTSTSSAGGDAGRTAPVPSGTGTPGTDAASAPLEEMLAGEHAAVFGYAVVTARIDARRRATAERLWEVHRAERDALEEALVARGATPVAAQAAYDVGTVPATPAAAVALGLRIETGLATVAASALAATATGTRMTAADHLVDAARYAALWSAIPVALPGALATATPTGTAVPTGTTSAGTAPAGAAPAGVAPSTGTVPRT